MKTIGASLIVSVITLCSGITLAGTGYQMQVSVQGLKAENPIVSKGQDDIWRNTLTFDLVNPSAYSYTWSFSPRPTSTNHRGFAFNGAGLSGTHESYAWTLWVR